MDARQLPAGPGKTTPRLIQDLIDHDPRYALRTGRNLLTNPAPQYKGKPLPRNGPQDCRHRLKKKVSQTNAPVSNDEQPDATTSYVVATYCEACHYHFTIKADYRQWKDGQVPCHLGDEANPLHHLRFSTSPDLEEYREKYGKDKYHTVIEAHRFVCTGSKDCPLIVDIEVHPPRLLPKLLDLLTVTANVFIRGQKAIQKNPTRLEGLDPLLPVDALGFLRHYLLDAKSNTEKRIARRNKKYMIAFADDCDMVFEYLDFKPIEEDEDEEQPEEGTKGFWQLPTITDTNREFIDDVLAEIDLLIAKRPQKEHDASKSGRRLVSAPVPALKDIERTLGYFDCPKRSRIIDTTRAEHPYYASLGAVEDLTDEYLSWAYDRQCECDPANKPYYLDCLEDIAKGRESSDLQMKVVMATSAGEYGLKAIENSYKFFGLPPYTNEGDDHIMGLYKSRIESAPRQKDEARAWLQVIARHRNSERIEALANDKTMSYEEALEFLNVSADTDSDSIEAAAVALSLDADKSRVARALRVISNQRGNDYTLQRAAASMESGGGDGAISLSEAYLRLQIGSHNVRDETVFAYYQSLTGGSAPNQIANFTEALRVIALARQSNFLLRKLDDPDADVQASTAEPVGLDNIGNTCYLNSLLQYYYTVKPIRDMVIDFQNHRTNLESDAIRNKRVGGRIVNKREIMKAQKFVEELRNLFENLKTASTRSIKPTRELAELTIFSSEKEETFRRASISSPQGFQSISSVMDRPVFGPQWPAPAAQPQLSPIPAEDDIEMIDRPTDKAMENGDDSSEATLVDGDALPSYKEIEDSEEIHELPTDESNNLTEHMGAVSTSELEGDTVMVNGNLSNVSVKTLPAPENPPPVPPRNKSGLVIQTTENKDFIADDALWRFGSQQDVTEVIGNVTFRLQCAIKPTSVEEGSGEQIDIIRDTFFGTNTVYTQKAQSLERRVEAWPTIIVFPGNSGPRDIYEALDVVYDEQIVEVDQTTVPQYSSISKLPPVLQIQIQRTDFDSTAQRSWKNRTPVVFPETIYLDRYVDSGDPDSAVMRRRRETWKWKSQLRTLNARYAALKNTGTEINVPDALLATKDFISALQEEEIEGIDIDPTLPEVLEERISEIGAEMESISSQINVIKRNLQQQFMDMREYEYKLHAVFIHRGEAGGGHYWIYIYDFEHDVWREYNDEYVSEVKDRRKIFEHESGAGGTPYYLVYVRSADQSDLVDAVCREVEQHQVVEMVDHSDSTAWPSIDDERFPDTDADADGDMDEVRHIEHVAPRPLRPKPADDQMANGWDDQKVDAWTARVQNANGSSW